MELIKKVVKYLLANPLYAAIVAVCFVAIVIIIVALCVKSSKAKKQVTASTETEKIQATTNALPKTETYCENDTNVQAEDKELEPAPADSEENAVASVETIPLSEKVSKSPVVNKQEKDSAVKNTAPTPLVQKKPTQENKSIVTEKTVVSTKNVNETVSTPVESEPTISDNVAETNTKKSTRYNGKWTIWRLLTKTAENEEVAEETYFFELVASNGEKLLSSEEYTSFAGAQKGIQTHKANILKNNFKISLTKKGDYIFKLLSGKNTLLCTGENYPTKIRCENAVESTKRFAETAVIDENVHDLIIQLPTEDIEEIPEPDNGYNGKWVISSMIAPDGDQIFYFELFASNGEKLLSSEEYTTYNGVVNGINTHKNNIERNNFRISLTKRGDYIFKLLNANDQLLCLGEHYKTRRRCESAVESVKRFAKTAPIMDSPSVKKYSQQQ